MAVSEPHKPRTWTIPEVHESAKRSITRQDGYGRVSGEVTGASMFGITCDAVYNAIEKWILDYPITPQKVLKSPGKI